MDQQEDSNSVRNDWIQSQQQSVFQQLRMNLKRIKDLNELEAELEEKIIEKRIKFNMFSDKM